MYFTRSDTGFRVWFQVVRNNGLLRTDITGSDFTALVVDASDTTSSQMVVTQSQQKAGLYRFDVPSVFLVSNGSGEYGVSVELDTSSPPHVTTAFSEILKVSEDDFNSLSGSIQIGEVSASFTVDVDSIVSGVWEANRLNFTSSVDSFGWTVDRMFQTQSLTYQNTVDLVFSSSQIFNIITDISGNIDDLVYSSSQVFDNTNTIISSVGDLLFSSSLIYNDTQHVSTSVDLIFEDSQNLLFSSSLIYNETQNLIFSSSQVYNNTENIITDLSTVVSATTISGTSLSQLGIDAVVSGVWNAVTSTFNLSGTMGHLQNQTYDNSLDLVFSSSQIYQNTNDLIFSSSQIFNNTETVVANSETIISNSNQILSSVQVLLTGNTDLLFSSSQIYNNTVNLIDTTNNLIFSSSQIFNNTELLIASGSSEVTQASINNIVSGVWSAVTSTFNLSGTMGYIQNQTFTNSTTILQDTLLLISGVNAILGQTTDIQNIVASGSVEISLDSINTFVSSVWQTNDVTFNTSGTMGFLQNLIDDIRFETSQTLNNTTNIANGVTASLTTESIASVVSGVWSAASGVYDASGTMGFLQNQIGATEISASVSINEQAIANAVWNTLTSSMTTSGSAGAVLFTQTDALATKICEIYQILGLELGAPLTVSDVQRTVAAITQSISCVGDVVTVTRTS